MKFISIKELFPALYNYIPGWIRGTYYCITGATGSGKCMDPNTSIMMYDCTIKLLKDIQVGDLLMGDDSKPRLVKHKYSGQDNMFRVSQNKGSDYIINSQHILTLNRKDKGVDIISDISLPDYQKLSQNQKRRLKGIKAKINFPQQDVFLDPYLLGLWLGDGNSAGAKITTADPEILEYLEYWANIHGNIVVKTNSKFGYKITTPKGSKNKKLATILSENGLIKNKHVPDCFLRNSETVRYRLLAGLIDSDGHSCNGGYEIIQKNKILAEQITFLARSLGYRTSLVEKVSRCTNCSDEFNGSNTIYYRINFYGDSTKLPVLLPRKQQSFKNPNRNILSTGIKIEPIGKGDYVGIEVDGNGRFLLEDFTIVHNSKFARYAFAEWTYKYCRANNIPFIVIYFALEESVDFFWSTIILGKLNERTGKLFTYYQYKGFHEGMMPEDYAEVDKILPEIEDMKKYIKVYDDVSNPTGLLRTIEEELKPFGKLIKSEPIMDEQGNAIVHKSFVYNDPDFHTVVIADHLGLLSPESNKFALVNSLHLAISKWSEYVVKLVCKRYNCIVANVHQQEMA